MRSWNCKKFCLTTLMKSGLSFKASFWPWKLQKFCLTTMMISRLSYRASFWSWKLQIILSDNNDEIGIVVLFGLEMPEILSAPRAKCRIITLRTGSTNTFTKKIQIRFHYNTNTNGKWIQNTIIFHTWYLSFFYTHTFSGLKNPRDKTA